MHYYRSPWVEICGTRYGQQSIVVLDCALTPEFGIIHDIVLDSLHQPFLVCEKLITDCFSYHYHSYQIFRPNPPVFCICRQSHLYDHSVLSVYTVNSLLYVTLKYYLVEKL